MAAQDLVWTQMVNTITLVVLAITGALMWYQIRSNHDWNRRKETAERLSFIILGPFVELRRRLEQKADVYDPHADYSTVQLTPDEQRLLRDLLNYLEQLCIDIKNNLIDDDLAFDSASLVVIGYWRWARPYVAEVRKKIGTEEVLENLEETAARWDAREQANRERRELLEEEKRRKRIMPGKGRL